MQLIGYWPSTNPYWPTDYWPDYALDQPLAYVISLQAGAYVLIGQALMFTVPRRTPDFRIFIIAADDRTFVA
jgi:hypothetical protein